MTEVEREALDFLKRWLAWAEAGAVTGEFHRGKGLCCNAFDGNQVIHLWLVKQFETEFPFGDRDYRNRLIELTQHECPKRLAWVRAKIAELEGMDNG